QARGGSLRQPAIGYRADRLDLCRVPRGAKSVAENGMVIAEGGKESPRVATAGSEHRLAHRQTDVGAAVLLEHHTGIAPLEQVQFDHTSERSATRCAVRQPQAESERRIA